MFVFLLSHPRSTYAPVSSRKINLGNNEGGRFRRGKAKRRRSREKPCASWMSFGKSENSHSFYRGGASAGRDASEWGRGRFRAPGKTLLLFTEVPQLWNLIFPILFSCVEPRIGAFTPSLHPLGIWFPRIMIKIIINIAGRYSQFEWRYERFYPEDGQFFKCFMRRRISFEFSSGVESESVEIVNDGDYSCGKKIFAW